MAAKWQIYRDVRGEYRWRLRAGNGEIVATGESYRDHRGVLRGIEAVRRASHEASTATVDDQTEAETPTRADAVAHADARPEAVVPQQAEPADVDTPAGSGR